jgi:hypothetical protein
MARGFVYDGGGSLLAIQQDNQVEWTHQDPIVKSQRLTNMASIETAIVEVDPWGGETSRSINSTRQPRRYTTYARDLNNFDNADFQKYLID